MNRDKLVTLMCRRVICPFTFLFGLGILPAASAADPVIEGRYLNGTTPIVGCLYYANDGKTSSQGSLYTDKDGHFSVPNTFMKTVTVIFLGGPCDPDTFGGYAAGQYVNKDCPAHTNDSCPQLSYMRFEKIYAEAKQSKGVPDDVLKYILKEETIKKVKESIDADSELNEEQKQKHKQALEKNSAQLKDKL